MVRPKKISPVEFAKDYIELKALDKTDKEIAEHFGVSTRTVKRYLNRDDYVKVMANIDDKPPTEWEKTVEEGGYSSTEIEVVGNKISDIREEKIKEGIDEGKEKADMILNTAYKINMKRIQNHLNDGEIDKAGKIALSLLGLAGQFERRNEAIQQLLQINFNQGDQGISESLFFGSLRYGLKILDDDLALKVMDRIENYLGERNAINRGLR